MLSNDFHTLCVRVDGQLFRVRLVARTPDEANKFCMANDDVSVIDETDNGLIVVAENAPIHAGPSRLPPNHPLRKT